MWGKGQRNKVMKYIWEGAPESPLSMGPERPRYATGLQLIMRTSTFYCFNDKLTGVDKVISSSGASF